MCPRHWGFVSMDTRRKLQAQQREGKEPSVLWYEIAEQAVAEAASMDLRLDRRRRA